MQREEENFRAALIHCIDLCVLYAEIQRDRMALVEDVNMISVDTAADILCDIALAIDHDDGTLRDD